VKKRLFHFASKGNKMIGSETKNFWKRNKANIRSINFALVGSENFEAKRSENKKFLFNVSVRNACKTDLDFPSFRFEAKIFFCETGAR
jgi:hypothetical protein